MSDFVLARGHATTETSWRQRVTIGTVLFALAGALVWGGISLTHRPEAPKRQLAHIMILPDSPPPPPPPDIKKPPPKEEQLKQQMNTPKQETPPEPQQLKMAGTAGDGPSAFAAGEVKQDYIGGDIGSGSRYAAYVARLEQQVQAVLTRHKLRADNVKLFLWLQPDGSVQRFTITGGEGDSEKSLRLALAELNRVDEAPLSDMPMPVGLQISVR
jgi:protein TonB